MVTLIPRHGLNPLDRPIIMTMPRRSAPSHWVEHLPFAFWVVAAAQPRTLVELGAYHGVSYCGFCQAIDQLGLETRAFAVDTWRGDPHNGWNGPDVLTDLRQYHDPLYGRFSTLLEMTFDEAVNRFPEGSIDLLHIDGYHTYEAVRHDFETWRTRLSTRAVVLFHDVCERAADFGVWRYWAELERQYPSFTFHHEHGLGVLLVGTEPGEDLRTLAALEPEAAEAWRLIFARLGAWVSLRFELDLLASLDAGAGEDATQTPSLEQLVARLQQHSRRWVERKSMIPATVDRTLAAATARIQELSASLTNTQIQLEAERQARQALAQTNQALAAELEQICRSRSFRALSQLAALARKLATRRIFRLGQNAGR
jgi:hypothetical protein